MLLVGVQNGGIIGVSSMNRSSVLNVLWLDILLVVTLFRRYPVVAKIWTTAQVELGARKWHQAQ